MGLAIFGMALVQMGSSGNFFGMPFLVGRMLIPCNANRKKHISHQVTLTLSQVGMCGMECFFADKPQQDVLRFLLRFDNSSADVSEALLLMSNKSINEQSMHYVFRSCRSVRAIVPVSPTAASFASKFVALS